jgi:hypothetical protein
MKRWGNLVRFHTSYHEGYHTQCVDGVLAPVDADSAHRIVVQGCRICKGYTCCWWGAAC